MLIILGCNSFPDYAEVRSEAGAKGLNCIVYYGSFDLQFNFEY